MGILLPCDLSTWPSVVSYLNVLTSGLDSIQDVIVVLLQIHDLCNISIFNDEDDARYGNIGCGVSSSGIQNQIFLGKIAEV